ncbi:MAG: sialate O-acetylesterase [Firmicutes bacterium]|jgi:sialate O-acetylesterase|nr:sialate O-acetylesterase [Bacillota bacterium]
MKKKNYIIFILVVLFWGGMYFCDIVNADSADEYKFEELFEDKDLSDKYIKNENGDIVWKLDNFEDQKNSITLNGNLELGGTRYLQKIVTKDNVLEKSDGIEFDVNIQRMGNQGNIDRPIFICIPRMGEDEEQYYAIEYHMENMNRGAIIANLFRCKWSLINTKAPREKRVLKTGFFLLKERDNYRCRSIVNTNEEGNVEIKFYISGPSNKINKTPLIDYVDSSEYKIDEESSRLAFGTSGRNLDIWGKGAIVRIDNIRTYDRDVFDKRTSFYENNYSILENNMESIEQYNADFLVLQGALDLEQINNMEKYIDIDKARRGVERLAGNIDSSNKIENRIATKLDIAMIVNDEFNREYNNEIRRCKVFFRGELEEEEIEALSKSIYYGYQMIDDDGFFDYSKPVTNLEYTKILNRLLKDEQYEQTRGVLLPDIYSDGCILQAGRKINFWGRGIENDTIKVNYDRKVYEAKVENGKWSVLLDEKDYGGPYRIKISDSIKTIMIDDIYIGEVFLVAGQSNAEMKVYECFDSDYIVNKYTGYDNLKIFDSEHMIATRSITAADGKWNKMDKWKVKSLPAAAVNFVDYLLELQPEFKKIKIGLVQMTYGGSTVELFLPNSVKDEDNFIQLDDAPIRSGFWNGFMSEMVPYAFKAMIYYQGENSTQLGYEYKRLLKKYIRGIRTDTENPFMPIMLVQLTGYGENYYESDSDTWPTIREVQMKVASDDQDIGIVTAVDLSENDPLEIHPRDKRTIGKRLAFLATDMIYDTGKGHQSPRVVKDENMVDKYYVYLDRDVEDIVIKDNIDSGFELMNEYGKWKSAECYINEEENSLVVLSKDVDLPKAVRYAWRNYPKCSVFDKENYSLMPYNSKRTIHGDYKNRHTNDYNIRISNHFLRNYDGIVNLTKGKTFRMIKSPNASIIELSYPILGQSAGDDIVKLKRRRNEYAGAGTDENILKVMGHGLKKGDWIRNNTRLWSAREVIEVLDSDTLVVEKIKDQQYGDEIECYKNMGVVKAEK